MLAFIHERLRRMYGVDARGVVALRVGVGILVIYDILERTGVLSGRFEDLTMFYTDEGVWPRTRVRDSDFVAWSIFMSTGDTSLVALLFAAGLYAAVCLAFGKRPRTSAGICLCIVQGALWRCYPVMMGADFILMRTLFFMTFCPRMLQLKPKGGKGAGCRQELCMGSLGLFLLQGLVYLGAGLTKAKQFWIVDGTTVMETLRGVPYGVDRNGPMQPLLELPEDVFKMASRVTVFAEIFIGVVALFPFVGVDVCRLIAFVSILGLHIGINSLMFLGNFGFVSVISALPLLPTSCWDQLERMVMWRPQSNQEMAGDVIVQSEGGATVEKDLRDESSIPVAQDNVEDASDSSSLNSKASNFVGVIMCGAALVWQLYVNPRLYCMDNDSYGCYLPDAVLKLPPPPANMLQIAELVGMSPQAFSMFYKPRTSHGWGVTLGKTMNGTVVKLPTFEVVRTSEEAYKRPSQYWYPSFRWRQYDFKILAGDKYSTEMWNEFCGYFCRTSIAETKHKGTAGMRLMRIQAYFVRHPIKGWGEKEPTSPEKSEYADYPDLQPERLMNWFCTQELVERHKRQDCPECEAPVMTIVPKPTSQSTTHKVEGKRTATATYVGCFKNKHAARVNGHEEKRTYDQCRHKAYHRGFSIFGLEHPHGSSVAGQAECLLLADSSQYLKMAKAVDTECEVEFDSDGNRMGGYFHLAVYGLDASGSKVKEALTWGQAPGQEGRRKGKGKKKVKTKTSSNFHPQDEEL